MTTMTFPAQQEFLPQGVAFVAAYASAAGLPPARVMALEIAVEEALTNICQYAYTKPLGVVEVHCYHDESQQLCIALIDTGKPFNILALPAPDFTADVDGRLVGGLGVHLLRALVDEVTYRREGDRNVLQLIVSHHSEA
jgi:anti-sigma regulatory factor (Ser/Thr protein kinase)